MKVLMVNKFLYPNGGSETYIFKLGDYLKSQGHEVQYFGMEHEGRCVGNHVDAYTSDMDFHGGSKLSKLKYSIKTIYSTEARKQIRKVLEDFQPDVVHLNNFNYQLTPSIILEIVSWRKSINHHCRIIYTAHDYQLVCPNHMLRNSNTHRNCEKCLGGQFINCIKGKCIHGSIAKSAIGMIEAVYWNIRGTYKYIDRIICPSKFVKSKLDSNPLFRRKTIAIHNFIDIPNYCENKSDERYVLYFGRLSEEKGIKILIEVCKSLPNVNFFFVGTGPLIEEVKKVKNIDYKGFKQGDDLWNLIGNAEFVVSPSVCNETYGLSNGEAIKLGTPVIATRLGAFPETIVDGLNGKLIKPGDVKSLRSTISALWSDKDQIEVLKKGCKETKLLSVDEYCRMVIKTYS